MNIVAFGRYCVVAAFSAWLAISAEAALALVLQKTERHGYVEYLGITGVLEGRDAPYRLLVPGRWNGTLLVYARGTGSLVRLDTNGRPLDANGNLLGPNEFPLLGLTPLANRLPEITSGGLILSPDDQTVTNTLSAFEGQLLELGYALAATDYKPDPRFLTQGLLGWMVEDAVQDIPALTVEAKTILFLTRGATKRTILWARSQGSIAALSSIERLPGRLKLYDGTVTGCTVGNGASRSWDSAIDLALAFDVVFANEGGWPWGLGKINENVIFGGLDKQGHPYGDVFPVLLSKVSTPTNLPRFEFIRLLGGLPSKGFYPFPLPPDNPGFPQFNWLFTDMLFATEVRADVERKAGGSVGQNLDHLYRLSDGAKAYLQSIGLPVSTTELWLAAMNNRRTFAGSARGKVYTARFADFTGAIKTPVLNIHTTIDGLVLPSQTTEYRQTLVAAGTAQDLRRVFVEANGHCAITPAEWLATLTAMNRRLDLGRWPSDGELANIFVYSPTNGLRFVTFDPGRYPQPPHQ